MGWIGPVLQLVGGVIAGAISKHQSDKALSQDKKYKDYQQQQLEMLKPYSEWFLRQAQGNYGSVQNYLQSLAGGNQQQMMQTLAPEINAMTQGQLGAANATRSLFPRGGMTASQGAQLPLQLQGNVNNMLFGARRDAMGQLGQLAGNQGSLGLSAFGQGAGLTNSMLNYGLQARDQTFNQAMQVGSGLANAAWTGYLMRQNQAAPPAAQNGGFISLYNNASSPSGQWGSGYGNGVQSAVGLTGNSNTSAPSYGNYLTSGSRST